MDASHVLNGSTSLGDRLSTARIADWTIVISAFGVSRYWSDGRGPSTRPSSVVQFSTRTLTSSGPAFDGDRAIALRTITRHASTPTSRVSAKRIDSPSATGAVEIDFH